MRVHRVRLSAFGPFSGTEEVDLDALSSAGLFLLHGPTGAGKTSVLDAVCFALFGVVPGARAAVTRLRSDHAPDGAAPQVVCEFTASGRRFEVTRSPAWERPKKRGTGTTTEQARVLVRELVDGDWQPLTHRVDEAGHLLEEVLGLGAEQFTKLVLLPQGEFAAFLRADAESRRAMLERLFGTDRFAAVQQWLRERQQDLRREVESATNGSGRFVAQADQAAAVLDLRCPSPRDDQGLCAHEGDPAAHVAALRALVARASEDAVGLRAATSHRAARAAGAARAGADLARRREEHRALLARRDRLQRSAPEQDERRRVLEAARRAQALGPLLAPLASARRRCAQARDREDAAQEELDAVRAGAQDASAQGVLPLPPTDEDVAELAARARERVAELAAAEQDAARRAELEVAVRRALDREREAGALLQEGDAALAREAALLAELSARRAEAAVRLAGRAGVHAALDTAQAVARAWIQVHRLDDEAALLAVRADGLRRRRDEARERWLDLRERRLDGMAALLAAGLHDGGPCPVCGSAEHPAPAQAQREPVEEEDERRAHDAVEQAARAVAGCEAELAATRALLVQAREATAGRDVDQAQADLAAGAAELAALEEVERDLGRIDHELAQAQDRRAALERSREHTALRLRDARESAATARERLRSVQERVEVALGDAATLAVRRTAAEREAQACDRLLQARHEVRSARRSLDELTRAAARAAAEGGFADLDGALAAALDEPALAELAAAVKEYDDEAAAVADRVDAPDLLAAAMAPAPDLVALSTAEELARADDEAAAARLALCASAAEALAGIDERLRAHLAGTAPLLERSRTLSDLSRCLDGTGGENARRMSLSAYVLAARLEQVAEAASLRLAAMSGGRYTLVHSDEADRGRGRAGLALRVVDGWTGRHRDTATLSGGESFYTSLALALGLADVVTAEAGGACVETLFVDEGFGSLDDETLEEVMDVLDGLRAGGRAVGLVSHVPELRVRIPSRLEVVKTRTGSRLRQESA